MVAENMTEKEKELILKLSSKKIGVNEFKQQFAKDIESKTVFDFLENASIKKNSCDLYYGFLLGFSFKTFDVSFVDLLNKLILEDWHQKHEDIADLLKILKSPKSVDPLYETALKKFEYLNYDNSVPLASKCVYALYFIHTEKAKEKLKLLSEKADQEEIKEDAFDVLQQWSEQE